MRNAPPPENTFGDLRDYWLDSRAPRKRSQKDDESIIRKHLRPAFGTMKLRDFVSRILHPSRFYAPNKS